MVVMCAVARSNKLLTAALCAVALIYLFLRKAKKPAGTAVRLLLSTTGADEKPLYVQSVTQLGQLAEASKLCADAFLDASSYNYIYALTDERQQWAALNWLFERNAQINCEMDCGSCLGMRDVANKLQCFFMLVPPHMQMSTWDKLRCGLVMLPIKWGMHTLSRMEEYVAYANQTYARLFDARYGKDDYFKLERMVVEPSAQGKGIGTKCLAAALVGVCDKAAKPCVLQTQLPQNVKFYKRLGFEVFAQEHKFGAPQYFMARDPPCSHIATGSSKA